MAFGRIGGTTGLQKLDAHDGKIIKFGSTYYLYGTSYGCGWTWFSNTNWCGFRQYSSSDSFNWVDQGRMFDPTDWPLCNGTTAAGGGGCYRARVVLNPNNSKYTCWWSYYGGGSFRVAFSDTPLGPWVDQGNGLVGNPATATPAGGVEDFDILVDGNNGYIVWDMIDNYGGQSGHRGNVIQALNSTFTSTTGAITSLQENTSAPAIFKSGSSYYVVHSDLCAYCGNGKAYALKSSSPLSGWSMPAIISTDSCGGQVMSVFQRDSDWIFVSDLWQDPYDHDFGPGNPLGGAFHQENARYYFGKLSFDGSGNIQTIVCDPGGIRQ